MAEAPDRYPASFGIKSWAEDDRPREKLMLKGRAVLSDAELIAILLGSGSPNESAVELAKKVLQSVNNNLEELGRLKVEDLQSFKGIGEAKAINIITALELGRRRREAEALVRKKITNSQHVFELMQPVLADLDHEEFWALFLNSGNRLLAKRMVSRGGWSATMADMRVIFREALRQSATAMIVCHNHPSGDTRSSQADRHLTKKLTEAGKLMDIRLLDHVIIGGHQFMSFADEGML